ncbi:cell division site-positioning protein MapZ family protein [Streptococcus dysgalactiae subsp. equisimilis]
MSEESKEVEVTKESQTLGLNEAKSMTVGEAVRKESEIKAGVTEDDSILDKYIKQHRDEVSSQKFDAKYTELDTASLDNFIKKQREELSKAGLVDDDFVENEPAATELSEPSSEGVPDELASVEAAAVTTGIPVEAMVPVTDPVEKTIPEPQVTQEQPVREQFFTSNPRQKRGWLIALLLLLLAILATVFGWNYLKQDNTKTNKAASSPTTQTSKTAASKKAQQLKADVKAFEKKYSAFYTDATKSNLKNSAFTNLPELEKALKSLEGSSYYDKAKEKVDALKKAITAITAVNGKFVSDTIVDGNKVAAEVKPDANFDDLSSATLTTGNANLDAVLQASITEGRQQLATKAEAAKAASDQAAAQSQQATEVPAAQTSSATVTSSGYGITAYNPASLQRQLSRVPYNDSLIADSGNPAWAFNPGILEKIVATSQARGYISGNQYILEPVNIINGNGYYNMFKPDGTYLFSINCKTGYFVGNAKGYSDALDY